MTITLNGDSGITAPTYGGTVASEYHVPVTAFKNRIINGAMVLNQRNLGTVTSVASDGLKYTIDRWWAYNGNASSKFSFQQSTDAPAGFSNSFLFTSSSSYSVGAGEEFSFGQFVEGFNFADMAWGTSSAKSVTLSFWVKSSLTGTFGGSLMNTAYNRSYPFAYTISAANTWEQKSITIAGDTTGTWVGSTNGIALRVIFGLGVGSSKSGTAGAWAGTEFESATGAVSVVGTNGATFYITGVQLEKGSNATSFDYRPYGTELSLCQRYYQLVSAMNGTTGGSGGTLVYCSIPIPIEMRTTPSLGQTGVIGFETPFGNASTQSSASVTIISAASNTRGVYAYFGNFSGLTANYPLNKYTNSNSLTLSAEL